MPGCESAGRSDGLEPLLAEQVAYYCAMAAEYEDHAIPGPGGSELVAALDRFRPAGRVLELACGTGVWTELLLRHATSLTAVDASPEMLAIASARVNDERVLRAPDELIYGDSSSIIRRRLKDGTSHRAVKVPYEPKRLEERLESLGWRVTVTPTSGPFFWGVGSANPS